MSSLIARATLVLTGVLALAAAPSASSAGQADRPSQGRAADDWVTTQIQAKYFLDRDIKARTVDVTTINGNVTLSGQVNSAQERERASDIAARIPGVRNVDNRLTVAGDAQPAGTSGQSTPPPARNDIPGSDEIARVTHSDPVILSQIKAKYAIDPDVSAVAIDVDVDEGIVRLRGDVASVAVRERAEMLARAVPGVKSVKNELKVKQ